MTRKAARPGYCTDACWMGRVDCAQCKVRQMMLFSDLPGTAFEDTLRPIDNFIFPAGSVLFEEGKSDAVIFTIRRGLVKLLSVTSDGRQRIVRLLGRGSVIGLELLEGRDSYRHSAAAVNEVDACRIPVSIMDTLNADYPQLCQQIGQRLQDHLDRADRWIVTLGTGPARERVINLLLLLTEYSSDPNGDIELLHREDMAAIVGTSVETVSRIIAELKRRNLLYKVTANLYRCDSSILQPPAGRVDPTGRR